MPRNRYIVAGVDNKEGKRVKYSDDQPQEGEEDKAEPKAKEVTNKGSESVSTMEGNSEILHQQEVEEETEVASDTKCSDFEQTILKNSGGKNLGLLLQLKKQDENSEIPHQEEEEEEKKGSDSGDSYENDIDESDLPGIFLFKMQLPSSNRLVVPAETAADFFPSLTGGSDAAVVLQITDDRDDEWNMSFIYYSEENVFMFTKRWTEFTAWHNLEAMDVIRFYRPVPRLSPHHYLIQYERRQENLATSPECRRENFLFQLELNSGDIGYSRLFIPRKEVAIHFPAIIQIHGTIRKKEIVKFTDVQNKNWYMDTILYNAGSYMIIDGWDEFVKEHNLEAMDLIKFYKPVHPSHKKHFLIEIARKVEAEANLTQSTAVSFTGSGSGCDLRVSSEEANQEVQAGDAGNDKRFNDEHDWPEDVFLFEMQVLSNNVLAIPARIAAQCFPILSSVGANPGGGQLLQFTHAQTQEWDIPFTYNREEQAFTNTTEWEQISSVHNLNASDFILFYRPWTCLHNGHYLIEFDRREEFENHVPEFREENFLLQLKLDKDGHARIFLPQDEVIIHFPVIRMPEGSQKKVTMKFTDRQRKNWYMDIIRYNAYFYVIVKGWEDFAEKNNLVAMDAIRFYKPVNPSHRKHFLIEIVKKDPGGLTEEHRVKVVALRGRKSLTNRLWRNSRLGFWGGLIVC